MSEKGFGETERKIEPLCLCAASQDCLCNFRRKRGERELAGCLHPPAACGDYGNTVSSNTNPNDQGSSSSRAEYGETRPLNLNRKVFLSHSGRDKNFVRFLHQKLCRQYRDDRFVFFFDEDSLPTAEPISMENILLEARGCELGVLVLSDDFFTHTRNPMLELEALTASKVRLLPLFYKISVDGFKEARNQSRWEERWKEWSGIGEERIKVWRNALQYVTTYSGPDYSKRATNKVEYSDLIVNEVTRIIRPRIPYSEEGVYGMDRLCEVVDGRMYNECARKRLPDDSTLALSTRGSVGRAEDGAGDALDLVGIYGFTGLGKTTLCKSLCDFYFAQFHGKVCWIDLGSLPSDPDSSSTYSSTAFAGRIHHLLTKLAGHSNDVRFRSFSEVQNLLKATICYRNQPLFLAIDNILPNRECLEEVDFYLSCKLPKDSKIFITAKSKEILEVVVREHTKFSVVLEHIPSLEMEEAKNIFMHKFSKQSIANKESEVKEYVRICHIHTHMGKCYHPLMLKSLAASIRHDRSRHVDWKGRLRELQSAATLGSKTDAWNMVFKVLDITYGVLSKEEQKVFLDLALYYRTFFKAYSLKGYDWIQCVHSHCHKERLDKILSSLADRAFIDWEHGSHINRMHDLMVDFSIFKLSEDAMGCNLHNYYLVLDNGSCLQNQLLANAMRNHKWPSSLPKSVRTVSISGGICSGPINEELDLRKLEGMEVLHVRDNPGVREVLLSPTSVAHLRSFIVRIPPGSPPLCFILDEAGSSSTPAHQESMPGGPPLAWVELKGNIIFKTCRRGRSLLANNFVSQSFQSWWQRLSSAVPVFELGSLTSLRNLQYLSLSQIPAARSIDLTTCSNLKRLYLQSMPSLTRIHGLEKSTNLENLHVSYCGELVELSIPVIDTLDSWVFKCRSLERIALHTTPYIEAFCTWPGSMSVRNCTALRTVDGITQYSGHFVIRYKDVKGGNMQEAMQALVGSIETDSSKFKASVKSLSIGVQDHPLPKLAGVTIVKVGDVQHASLLISALCKVQAANLSDLAITCKADSSCGCDKNVPQFESLKLCGKTKLQYNCRQVRDLTSLARVGNRLKCLNLRGCRSVEVWPNFATMTSIRELDLSYTSLEEWPMGVQLLPLLVKLDIRGCMQLPEKEMVKGITCQSQPAGSSGCSRGALASLLADLKDHRRDRGSVADALHSNGPVLETLLREQWLYLCNSTMSCNLSIIHGAELCLLIMLMYYVWFGEVEDHNMSDVTDSSESSGPSATMKKMKELLCSEIFMSLPFDAWPKGGADSCERYMAVALIGAASIGYFNVPVNDDLKDQIVNFLQPFVEAPQCVGSEADMLHSSTRLFYGKPFGYDNLELDRDEHEMLAMRVGNAGCKMVRVPNVAAALGQDFRSITMDGLQAKSIPKGVSDLECIVEAREPSVVPELGEEPTPTTMDSLGARVLRMVMLKIMPHSILVLLSPPTHISLETYLPV